MKFHAPSFVFFLRKRFDVSFDIYTHNWIVYVTTFNKYFTSNMLRNLVSEAMIDALDAPLAAPDGPRRRSVLDAPIDVHIAAVEAALQDRRDYLEKRTISPQEGGERIEFRIFLKRLRDIVIECRKNQDVEVSKHLIAGEVFMSDRLLEKRFLRFTGIAISNRRAREIMQSLVDQGILKNNGNLRTAGREVIA